MAFLAMSKLNRQCLECKAPLTACMGFVIAGDLMAHFKDKSVYVRELCGKCGYKRLDDKEFDRVASRLKRCDIKPVDFYPPGK
jgi:ribosomal protein S27AE